MSDRQCDVVVVGAGPAGAVSASLLARRGLRVVLLDRAAFPRRKACAEYMSPGVEDALRAAGLDDAIRALDPLRVPGMEIVSPGGSRLRLSYTVGDRAAYARTLTRERLDEALVRAASDAGAEVLERVTVRSPMGDENGVRGVIGSFRGKEVRIDAPMTVVADGARSSLAASLGLAVSPRWPVRLGLVAHYEGPAQLTDGFGQMHVAHDGYCGVAPLSGGMLNVAVVVRPDVLRRAGLSAAQYMDRWIAGHPRLSALLEGCRRVDTIRGVVPIGSRARRSGVPGALLVGDAAGFFDPFTGEGIYRAIRGAELVAEVVPAAVDGGYAPRAYLATYESMRRCAFRRKLAVTALVQAFVQYPRLMEYGLPRLANRPSGLVPLSSVLGDIAPAGEFLNARVLWTALRP